MFLIGSCFVPEGLRVLQLPGVRTPVRRALPFAMYIVTACFSAVAIQSGQSRAQGTFPAPLPGQAQAADPLAAPKNLVPAVPAGPPSSFPGASAPTADASGGCMEEFTSLREEAEHRGRAIKAAKDRHAPPDEACRLIGDFERAELRMVQYVEAHAQNCAFPAGISSQLRSGHNGTEALLKKVCMVADQGRPGVNGDFDRIWPPKGPTGDFDTRR